jgi:hypothetical protein
MDGRCREFRRAFLLEGNEEWGSHAESCADCRAFVDAERKAAELLRAHGQRERAPLHLRERVAAVLDGEAGRRARGLRRRRVIGAAAALAALGAVAAWAVVSRLDGDGRHRAHETMALVAEDFLEYAPMGKARLQIESGDAAAVERFFAERVRLAAKVPPLKGLTLVGGRRCAVGGRPAALAFLERRAKEGAEHYGLFVFEPRGEDWSAMPEVPNLGGRRACHQSKRGVTILVWEERGLVYALAGALEIERLKEFADGLL